MPPLVKRGALAWENAQRASKSGVGTFDSRLNIHAVDTGAANVYLKVVGLFLHNCKMNQTPLESIEQMDCALAKELGDRCFLMEQPLNRGMHLFFGLLHLAPEYSGHLPRSYRALKTWKHIYPSTEGGPLPPEIVYAVIWLCFKWGAVAEGMWIWLSMDGYLRQQDCRIIRGEDIADDKSGIAITLAPRSRGERVKTGSNQGFEIDCPVLVWAFRMFVSGLAPGCKVFTIDTPQVARVWSRALRELGVPFRSLHALRHTMPSEDCASGRRSLERIRRRGRWAQMKSVQRYAKSHALRIIKSQCPGSSLSLGEEIRSKKASNLSQAIASGPGATSLLGGSVLKGLKLARKAALV